MNIKTRLQQLIDNDSMDLHHQGCCGEIGELCEAVAVTDLQALIDELPDDFVVVPRNKLQSWDEAMMWELGGEPIPSLMVKARHEIQAMIESQESEH